MNEKNQKIWTISELEEEHLSKFGVKPHVIGMHWDNPNVIFEGIIDAIETGKPYNEYEKLSPEDQKAFDDGMLLF